MSSSPSRPSRRGYPCCLTGPRSLPTYAIKLSCEAVLHSARVHASIVFSDVGKGRAIYDPQALTTITRPWR